ncbi:MAG: TIM barrel protein, partial [Armatimonadetes bacterium]|nr:TIM barrel protein [Armatimonadota bacterium]
MLNQPFSSLKRKPEGNTLWKLSRRACKRVWLTAKLAKECETQCKIDNKHLPLAISERGRGEDRNMRLGGAVFVDKNDLEVWAAAQVTAGYSAVFPPFGYESDESRIRELQAVCQRHNLLIAEVGAWSNPISSDDATRNKALEHCIKSLDFAERLGARCCVNIAGARGEQWDGPHPNNLTEETFDLIVETTRAIIDSVKPKRTCYSLETMPWVFPDSPESYLRLLHAIDRPGQFGVHLDPVNIINSPQRYFENGKFLRSCFEILAPHIVSCHAKDITL